MPSNLIFGKKSTRTGKIPVGHLYPSFGRVTLSKRGVTVTRLITLGGLVWQKIVAASNGIENYTFLSHSFKHKHTHDY
jgi:hypothetical protein